ncbi:MAG: sulfurtransferase [Gammaproteobacteria bacterium]|nr:sulfurtransferase [Gammaproteobacteria bacterium]
MPARYQDLVSTQVVAHHLDDADWVLLDCRYDLTDSDAGNNAYASAHLPGAVYADLERDLSSAPTSSSGRHPLPQPATLGARLGQWGVDKHTQLVVYDDSGGAFAARAWWLARWLGHEHVAVLDGGLRAWQRHGLPMTTTVDSRDAVAFEFDEHADWCVDVDQLQAELASGALLLDARSADRFMGDIEPLDSRAGHIPGAHNYPFAANLDERGHFLQAAELRACFDAASGDHNASEIICMCGSGVTACHNLLAMAIAGLPGARLYPGSWSEWCSDPDRPVATGPDC